MKNNSKNCIWRSSSKTILGLLLSAVKKNPNKIYCKTNLRSLTFLELIQSVKSLSLKLNALPKNMPVARQDLYRKVCKLSE